MTFLLALVLSLGSWHVAPVVTWYGPGLWGNTMACGGKLWRDTIAVASRDLRCGTRVLFSWKGHSITLTVRDRTGGVLFDMTRRAMHIFIDAKPHTLYDVAWRVVL